MNVKKPKIKIGHNLRVPKRKKTRLNPLGVQKNKLSKLHGTVKTRKKPHKKSSNKSHSKKDTSLRDKIKKEKKVQQKSSEELKKNIKKLQTLVVSFSGLEQLSKKSIADIQKKRQKICAQNQEIVKRINLSVEKLAKYESKYKETS
ncbi:hypothetical protein SCCGRSA3_02084 [Marine Group I thaumarchaeote SCGC RSA3]|uniref:Uncharacterized protein n=3 Tax=Marine Group I TaxID=905826 RepID=A0A081RMU0_9ARCH|nr:hypothetical protein AAA799N04_01005 [Marine Group I thaumarchaeote SCGC AAA799-N04]KFM15567.1 hypothetical protein AAA799D11_01172 [Marine Group I thaumarchaeote SCGC AAA799-D11]KFM16767.1 hypothetical protein SCCGRSA3_02084 [Marine Group I thaumarchaeote SCGC RSA3]